MPAGRPRKGVDEHRDEIIAKYEAGLEMKGLLKFLKEEKGVDCTERTLNRRIVEWDVPRKRIWLKLGSTEVEKLKTDIRALILQRLDDKQIVQKLNEQGYHVTKHHVVTFRKELGMRRRHDPKTDCQTCKQQGRYPKESCEHQIQHLEKQRKSAEVSKGLREELNSLKKQMRTLTKQNQQLQREVQELKQNPENTPWHQQLDAGWPPIGQGLTQQMPSSQHDALYNPMQGNF